MLLLHSTGGLPNGFEIDAPIVYSDYYFLEALVRQKIKMKSIIISLFLLSSEIVFAQANKNEVSWNQEGTGITFHANLAAHVQDVKIQIRSDRNTRITKITDISREHPEPQTVLPNPIPNKEIWYPVVDFVRTPGMKGHIMLDSMASVSAWNQHFSKSRTPYK